MDFTTIAQTEIEALAASPAAIPGLMAPIAPPQPRRPAHRGLSLVGALALTAAVATIGGPVFAASTPAAPTAAPAVAANGDSTTVIDVVKTVGPAVVTIDVTTGGTGGTTGPGSTTVPGLGSGGNGGQVVPTQGTGSGVIIDPSGLILTNRHVAGDATSVTVTLADGRVFPGKTVGVDTLTDFAFVKIDATDLPTATLGESSTLQVGQLAIAIGDPLGQFPGTVTSGIISGLDRTIDVASDTGTGGTTLRHLIQTDASINPGNSGGPLLDGDGKVIGIDTATSGSAQGIGFALPVDLAKPIITQVLAGKPIERPWIGIVYQGLDAQVAKDNSLSVTSGAWIHSDAQSGQPAVVGGSPAEKAGLKEGDIIVSLDGQAIDGQHQLDLLLLQHAPGDKLTLSVLRDGQTMSIDLTLGTRPAGL